jgi:hypothetical protein
VCHIVGLHAFPQPQDLAVARRLNSLVPLSLTEIPSGGHDHFAPGAA